MKRRFTKFYMRADAFACNCRDIETEALAAHVPREHVHYLPNAVDTERYRPARGDEKARIRAEQGWRADAQLCFFVGRLSAEKGVLDLLTAWRDVGNAKRILVLVGPDMTGPLDAGPAARRFVASMGMQSSVIFHGASVEIARLLRAADLYVQPSHYESFSNALIEAMAMGCPSSPRASAACSTASSTARTGCSRIRRIPPTSRGSCATLLDQPQLAARLGAKARETAVARVRRAADHGTVCGLVRRGRVARVSGGCSRISRCQCSSIRSAQSLAALLRLPARWSSIKRSTDSRLK